jgi:hypothetical protein
MLKKGLVDSMLKTLIALEVGKNLVVMYFAFV